MLFRSGILGMIFIFICVYLYSEKVKSPNAYRTANMFKKMQLISSGAFSIGHGGNDAQKVMGIIGAAFVAYNSTKYPDVGAALKAHVLQKLLRNRFPKAWGQLTFIWGQSQRKVRNRLFSA